jgi:hypothetical protein
MPNDAGQAVKTESRLKRGLDIQHETPDDRIGMTAEGFEGGLTVVVIVILELPDQHIQQGRGPGMRVNVGEQGLAVDTR